MTASTPRMIVAPPLLKKKKASGTGCLVKWYLCDDGIWYTIKDLAAATGIPVGTIYARIDRYRWWSPDILASLRQMTQYVPSLGTAEWRALGTRVRLKNLARLRQPGKFEQQEAGK